MTFHSHIALLLSYFHDLVMFSCIKTLKCVRVIAKNVYVKILCFLNFFLMLKQYLNIVGKYFKIYHQFWKMYNKSCKLCEC